MRTSSLMCFGAGMATAIAVGCGSSQGARPHDMSASQHEAAADTQAAAASPDPATGGERERCADPNAGACWSSLTHASEQQAREALRHHQMAAQHRAASQSLRDAEARACAGLRDIDRDMSPFAHREDIASVSPLLDPPTRTPRMIQTTVGVVVTLRALPGMTAEWLQRVVDCHLARNGALGHAVPEMEYCPLVLNGVTARVYSAGNGFAIELRTTDESALRELRRRAAELMAPPPGSVAGSAR